MLNWPKKISHLKKLLFLLVAALMLYVLCGVVCVTVDMYYYTLVTTSVAIDDSLVDVPEFNVNAQEEIDRNLNFAFNYFKENFRIKFKVKSRQILPADRIWAGTGLRPKGEKLITIFMNAALQANGSETAHSNQKSFLVLNNISFHENNEAHKWVLIHEICHQFNAVDLKETDSIMNGYHFYLQDIIDENNSTYILKAIDPKKIFPLDRINKEIIELSKREYVTSNRLLSAYPNSISKEIFARYKELLPKARYQGNLNFSIGSHYFNSGEYSKSLHHFFDSLKMSQTEKEMIAKSFKCNPNNASNIFIGEEDKYAAIVKALWSLDKYNDVISYASRISDEGKYALEKYRYLSSAYGMTGKIDLAIEYTKKVLDVKKDEKLLWRYLGHLYFRRIPLSVWTGEDIDRAAEAFKKTLELDPNNDLANFHLYAIYANNGQKKEADESLAKLKSINFDFNSPINKKDGSVRIQIPDEGGTQICK